ncbi:MAG: UDP-N-acetylmuramoylalanine--D-glutamate ligase [Actinomycetota bacterium]|jgi:UDP-N-acetylmuramoylalanine--D-glutamate ligase|nr:UDP-N-acetylmuramoylalanine--D-glutamate ligase [Actinomycetota bacterium]
MSASYDGLRVVVAGAGISGAAAADALRDRGAEVTIVDARGGDGVVVTDAVPDGTELVVTSPGWRPDSPLLVDAASKGIQVYGEVELAWRLRGPDAAPWLAVTGTNGKTTTVKMLASMLRAAGHRTVAAGNVGLPLLTAVLDPSYDVLAVELSSFQLHWSSSLRPLAAAVLNVAPDHLDWHGSMAAYAEAKARIWAGETSIGNADDEITRTLLSRAPGRRVGFTLRTPRTGELGLVEDLLVDRAFEDVPGEATELASLADLTVTGAHNVANALSAAALARAYGAPAEAVRTGLQTFVADPHRNAVVAVRDGVTWIDDSKATNPHAAAASLAAYDRIVWIAGGLLKGAAVDDLVRDAAPNLAAVVLLGTDRQPIRDALLRHAPDVPVVEVTRLDTEAMSEVVAAARRLARPGDTVLLAPAAASMDCFRDYKERGDLFAALAAG